MADYHFLTSDQDVQTPTAASELVRYFLVPLTVSLLFGGSVYWLREQLTGAPEPDSGGPIEVNVLQEPSPVQIAVPNRLASTTAVNGASQDRSVAESSKSLTSTASLEVPTPDFADEAPANVAPVPLPPAEASVKNAVVVAYEHTLLRHIQRFQHYPAAARRSHVEGTVFILFSVHRDGSIADIRIKTSSGQSSLDREALETLRRAQPLPAIPRELPRQLNILLPMVFELT